jgi:hypothetical protein
MLWTRTQPYRRIRQAVESPGQTISGIDHLRTLLGVGIRNGLAAAPRVCRNAGSAGPERPNDEVCSAQSLGRTASHAGTSESSGSIRLPGLFAMDASVLNFVTGFWSDAPRSHTFAVEGDRTLKAPYTSSSPVMESPLAEGLT